MGLMKKGTKDERMLDKCEGRGWGLEKLSQMSKEEEMLAWDMR